MISRVPLQILQGDAMYEERKQLKTNLLTDVPAKVDDKQLELLSIRLGLKQPASE